MANIQSKRSAKARGLNGTICIFLADRTDEEILKGMPLRTLPDWLGQNLGTFELDLRDCVKWGRDGKLSKDAIFYDFVNKKIGQNERFSFYLEKLVTVFDPATPSGCYFCLKVAVNNRPKFEKEQKILTQYLAYKIDFPPIIQYNED